MGIDVEINVATIKGQVKLIKSTQELQNYYRVILDEIRDLEFKRETPGTNEKISIKNIFLFSNLFLIIKKKENKPKPINWVKSERDKGKKNK